MPQTQGPWTTRRLLAWMTDHFTRRQIDSPRVAAEMLMAHVLGTERIKLYLDLDRPASELERASLRDLVERASRHEPVDYLVGKAPFFALLFKVTPAVLIPRPSTETLVEHIMQHVRHMPGLSSPVIADIGTGSGAIAVSLARHLPQAHIIATDLSEQALEVARENAQRHGVAERIEFRQGDLLEPLEGQRVHYLASNPPYICDAEWEQVATNVKDYEPTHALRGGGDGLDLIRKLIQQARSHLRSPGQVVIEIAASQKQAVIQLAEQAGLINAHVLSDHEGLPRVLVADRD